MREKRGICIKIAAVFFAAVMLMFGFCGCQESRKKADFTLDVKKAVDFEELEMYKIPAIITYGAYSCTSCQQTVEVVGKLNEEMQGKALIKFADVWEHEEAAGNVPVIVIPTQVFFGADGKPFVPDKELKKEIEFMVYNDQKSGEHVLTVHQGELTEKQMRMILKEMGIE